MKREALQQRVWRSGVRRAAATAGFSVCQRACLTLFAAALLPVAVFGQTTQTPATMPGASPMHGPGGLGHPGYSYQRPGATGAQVPASQVAGTPATPAAQAVAPPTTAVAAPSLLDQPAQAAKVDLSGGKLTVEADNSSLTAILHQVSTSAGMTIDGLNKDVRVFGTYGPGDPRDILSSLLDGTGYNVVMFGKTSAGTPSQLALTTRGAALPKGSQGLQHAAAPNQEDDEDPQPTQYQDPAPPPAAPPANPNPPNGGVRSPQQMLQELQQMHQQQQQEQQTPPQPQ